MRNKLEGNHNECVNVNGKREIYAKEAAGVHLRARNVVPILPQHKSDRPMVVVLVSQVY